MQKKDYYNILELTDEDKKLDGEDFIKKVKTNYRRLCKQFHPDKYANKPESERKEAEEKFKEITEAYDVLTDAKKKREYEQYGTNGGFSFDGFGSTGMDDIDEMLRHFRGGDFGNPFGSGFGFGMNDFGFRRETSGPVKPQPLNIRMHVSIEEIYDGGSKKIRYKRMVPCNHCDGKGFETGGHVETCPVCGGVGQVVRRGRNGNMIFQQTFPCEHCNGTGSVVVNPCKQCNGSGKVVETEEITIPIPAGVFDGASIILNDKGNYAERSKDIVGDLAVVFSVDPNARFTIANRYDLYTTIEVPILECITGGKTEIQLFKGKKISLDIPKFTNEGKVFRVNGFGLPTGNGTRGSLLVEVKHKFPKDISRSEEKLINELKSSKNFK